MKEFDLRQHSIGCNSIWCDCNPNKELFFLNNKFFIINYNICQEYGDKYDFFIDILKTIINNSKIIDIAYFERGVTNNLLNKKRELQLINRKITMVNYAYKSNNGTEYYLTTQVNYLNNLIAQDVFEENYKTAIEYLLSNNYDYLIPKLKRLKYLNENKQSNISIIQTIDELINNINQQIK